MGYQTGRRGTTLSSPVVLLVIVNIIAYIFLLIGGDPAYELLAQQTNLFFGRHYYWQLFTALFVHFSLLHIAFNMLALYYFGIRDEMHYSTGQFVAIYFGSGLLGNVLSLFLLPADVASGGASGAIFGLLGAYVAIGRDLRTMIPGLMYAGFVFLQSSQPGVNIFAHLFGLIGGLLLGLAFSRTRSPHGYNVGYNIVT